MGQTFLAAGWQADVDTIFGVPTGNIALALTAGWLAAALLLVWLGFRTRVLVRLALRHIPRRRAQTSLVILGLMLSTTIVTTALGTGDTMSRAIKSVVTASLGRADEVIVPGGTFGWRDRVDAVEALGRGDAVAVASRGSLAYSDYERVAASARGVPSVAALAPAAVQIRTVVDRSSRQTSPDIKVLALPARYAPTFGPIAGRAGPVDLADLRPGEVYLNAEAAAELGARPGHRLEVSGGEYQPDSRPWRLRVRETVRAPSLAGAQPTALVRLDQLWTEDPARHSGDQINLILVANRGSAASSVDRSAEVTQALRAALADRAVAAELYRLMSGAEFRGILSRYLDRTAEESLDGDGRQALTALSRELTRGRPTDEFINLLGDPETVYHLGQVARSNWASDVVWEAAYTLPSLHPLSVREVKRQGVEQADLAGSVVTSVFIVLGLFSIVVGVMLVFLIFVMLAAERRSEMGTSRAVGVRRKHLVQMYLFEGAVYSVSGSVAGVLAGLIVGRLAVGLLGGILARFGVHIEPYFAPRSLLIAFCLGSLLTFATVALSAWRVSRLNIVAAIRDLPESSRRAGRTGGLPGVLRAAPLRAALLLLVGVVLLRLGARMEHAGVRGLGVSLLVIGLAPLARRALAQVAGAQAERIAFTTAGLALLVYWGRPPQRSSWWTASQGGQVESFVLAGVMMVLGAVWVTIYNMDVLLRGLEVLLGRFPRFAAVLRTVVAYPRQARFRTGMVLAMFALVIFTMVVGSVLTRSTGAAYTDTGAMTGGFQLEAASARNIPDIHRALASASAVRPGQFAAAGSLARLDVESLRLDAPVVRWRPSSLTVVDGGWLRGAGFGLIARASGYRSDADIWRALADRPGLALSMPDNGAGGVGFSSLAPFEPREVWVRDPRGGESLRLRVVGLIDPRASVGEGLITRDSNVSGRIPRFDWSSYAFKLAPGADAHRAALGLELSFDSQGLSVDLSGEQALQREAIRILLNYLLTGFMGLGLVVGIAALGVIATRAVVERRRSIATLRAIGYPARLVQGGLVLEASIVAALGIGIGVLLGLVVARNIISFVSVDNPEILYIAPWRQIALLSLTAWAAVLATTVLPAWQAARVQPAEGLRSG